MPSIEVIMLRFNLDKDNDRRLFEALQKRTSPGKRNDYIKKLLLDCLFADREETRNSRKQAGGPAPVQAAKRADASSLECGLQEPRDENLHNNDSEATDLVSEFLQ